MPLTAEQIAAAEAAGASAHELDTIAALQERAGLFERAMAHLEGMQPAVAETDLEREWRALLERGYKLRARIQAATRAIDDSLSWARGVLGLDGLRGATGGNLGLVWLIPLAVVAAAVAALGWWLADYRKFARRFDEQQRIAERLRGEGVDPIEAERQAAAAVAGTVPGWLAPLQGPLGLLALGVGGYVIFRFMRG